MKSLGQGNFPWVPRGRKNLKNLGEINKVGNILPTVLFASAGQVL